MQTAKVMPVMEKDRAVVAKFKSHTTQITQVYN